MPETFTAYYQPAIGETGVNIGVVYTGAVRILPVVLDPSANYSPSMRLVRVDLGWVTHFGRSNAVVHRRSMQTYVGRYGLQNYIYNN